VRRRPLCGVLFDPEPFRYQMHKPRRSPCHLMPLLLIPSNDTCWWHGADGVLSVCAAELATA